MSFSSFISIIIKSTFCQKLTQIIVQTSQQALIVCVHSRVHTLKSYQRKLQSGMSSFIIIICHFKITTNMSAVSTESSLQWLLLEVVLQITRMNTHLIKVDMHLAKNVSNFKVEFNFFSLCVLIITCFLNMVFDMVVSVLSLYTGIISSSLTYII